MERIRKGNDIEILWALYAGSGINEVPYDLTGRNISLYIRSQFGKEEIYDFSVDRHILRFIFWGKDQCKTGVYSLVLVENEGREGMHTVDECEAFQLVNHSCDTGGESEGRVECVHLQFRSQMSVGFPSEGGDIVVDNVLSESSKNPVQNKVVTSAIQGLKSSINELTASVNELGERVADYDEAISEASSLSQAASKAVETLTEQVGAISQEVRDLSDKVESFENGEIKWTDVQ